MEIRNPKSYSIYHKWYISNVLIDESNEVYALNFKFEVMRIMNKWK